MHLKKHLLLFFTLFFLSVSMMAGKLSGAENSSGMDSLKVNHFIPNHIMLNDSVVNFGKVFLNTPYHYGSPGISSFDCSGFTSHVYRNFGYNLEHSSSDQAKQFDSIDRTQLKPGDLVFFSGRKKSKRVGHVGIVTAAKENGEFDFIHAAVHSGVTISNSNEEYYTKRFLKASRVIGSTQMLAISRFVTGNGKPRKDTLAFTPIASPIQSLRKVTPAEYHRVKSGETLSSISKEYGITVAELKRRNNIKGNKLSLKQSLKIKEEETVMVVEAVPSLANNFESVAGNKADKNNTIAQTNSSHSVKKGETLFSISKLYHISIDELKNINKILKEKIHPGQKLKISQPVNQLRNEALAKAEEAPTPATHKTEETPKSVTHKVLSGESLYSISKTYDVPVDELERVNNITNGKIHPGQELTINPEHELKPQSTLADKQDNKEEAKPKKNENTQALTHTIKKGENLGNIAKENNTTVEELKKINNLADSRIHQGQVLKISSDNENGTRNVVAEKIDKKQDAKIDKNEKTLTHRIKEGENLGSIARENNTTVEELKKINNLSDSKIHSGQELKINRDPDTKSQYAVIEKVDKKQDVHIEKKEKPLTHIIKKGENLGSIARENDMTVEELKRLNNLADSKIHQGQKLKINRDIDTENQYAVTEKTDKKQEVKIEKGEKAITHKIKKGESLISIAKDNNISVEELKKINHLEDNKIRFGQELKLTQSAEKINVKSAIAKNTNESDTKSVHYKVKSGESFYTIAKKYGCTVEELKDWNRKSGSKIKAGEEILIGQMANK